MDLASKHIISGSASSGKSGRKNEDKTWKSWPSASIFNTWIRGSFFRRLLVYRQHASVVFARVEG